MLITDQVATAPCTDPIQESSPREHRTGALGRCEVPEPDERDQNRNNARPNTALHLSRPCF